MIKKVFFSLVLVLSLILAGSFVARAQTASDQLNERKQHIEEINKQIEQYEQKIREKQTEAVTLKNELNILSNQITKTQLEIKAKQEQIKQTKIELEQLQLQLEQKQLEISKSKEELSGMLRLIFRYEQKSYLEIMLANNTFSNFFDQLKFSEQVQGQLQKQLDTIVELKSLLEDKQAELQGKKTSLEQLSGRLVQSSSVLVDKKDAKNVLINRSRSSEKEFQKLVRQLKLEQAQLNTEIVSLEKKIRQGLTSQQSRQIQSLGSVVLQWPVPSRVVTAYFHDPDYPYRYVYEHPAIDIRSAQGSPIYAAESGYIGRAKNAGMGYSYIMIIHNDQISTVYGHVSKISVVEDQFVQKGQVIGWSGGTPGTPGAGRLTFGPHLHFEVRYNGIPVNPLDYLP